MRLMAAVVLLVTLGACAQSPVVAFTFDDLPAHGPLPPGEARPQAVADILKALKAADMPPVYGFINGFRLEKYPYQKHILQAWMRSGNPLGNHTYSHPSLDETKVATYEKDIDRNEPLLEELMRGRDWHWFRYPYLEEGNDAAKRDTIHAYLKQRGYKVAEVSMDFQDYAWNDAYARCAVKKDEAAIRGLHDSYLEYAQKAMTFSRSVSKEIYGRDIKYVLLMHVGAFDGKMLPELIGLFRKNGFGFVTLEDAMSDPSYADVPAVYPGGGNWLEMVAEHNHEETPDFVSPEAMLDKVCK